ncbi:MAG: TetR/AcrR family transcriptional regulator [Desulfomonile tiedjei]|uniref:TetR/AcrR family transcriptional regulator n=1 Tax=Desulfomonile tiedjei TaxID=2358 RepID=A0A9D6V0F7_9BACT|nr:TetR/AcrR family transcriptional regulator [Desulfomonile tiedjei]
MQDLENQIAAVISKTKVHKDAFAIPGLIKILQTELQKGPGEDMSPEELVLLFVEKASDALSNSPIYSDALTREFYRCVLDAADSARIPRANLLEDLLFQTLRRPPDPEKSKRKKHKDARSRILHAALEEFSDKGFHACTIDSIAERAGIAKGTVYRYFSTKEGLFNALKESTITEFVELARQDLSREEDILKIIESVIRMYLSFFEKNSAFFKVIIQEHKEFGREFSEKFISELILGLPGLKRRCWKASRSGRLKQMNYFTVFYGIIGFLNGVIQKWLHDGAESSLLAEIETVKEVLFYGFVVPSEKI